MNDCFQNSLDHLMAELKRIELKLRLQIMKMRQEGNQTGEDKFRGLYISEEEIDAITGSLSSPRGDSPSATGDTALESLRQFEATVAEREKESRRRGITLRLHELKQLFHLSAFEIDTLLVCILPELDSRYQRLYAYLQNDVTRKSPTADLVLHLFYESFEDRLSARQAFSPEAALIKYHLLHLSDEYHQRPAPLPSKSLHIDERITSYLLETDGIDARLLSFTRLLHPTVELADVILPDETRERLTHLVERFKEEELICYFQGIYGVGKHTTAEAMCHHLGIPLLSIDVNLMLGADTPLELLIMLIFREGRLHNAALYFENYDLLLNDEKGVKAGDNCFEQELENYPGWVFLTGEKNWQPRDTQHNKTFIRIEFPTPSYTGRKQLWNKHWNGQPPPSTDVDFGDLAGKFQLSGSQIVQAAAIARSLALWRDPQNGLVTTEDLHAACRQQSGHKLITLAQKIYPKHTWNEIVLPRDQMEQLSEICNYVKHYHTVYGNWGFGRKLSSGKGLNVLFAGPPGTGKTMAADIMANELGLDLYKIDLSAIVSKYIGETEKNLDRIFREGQNSNAILFFDEADALFGKRSEVRDSHDRYANIEVAYLLQKMDAYEGMVILATNMRKNMDEAFARRMHFAVEFPIPEEPDRHRIWQNIFPGEAPIGKDADISFLARQFKITGGNIKNIALGAAFLAAQDGGSITMENLIRATKREYQKMGKLCTEADFAQYFDLVKW